MDDLRLILLLFGAGFVAVVYIWTRYQSRRQQSLYRTEPTGTSRVVDEPDDAAIQQELERMQRVMDGQEQTPAPLSSTKSEPERMYIISVVAAAGQTFNGDALLKALTGNGLQFGDKGIFHRLVQQGNESQSVYGLANLVKPGDFGTGDLRGFSTPGMTLILQLPGPMESIKAFDDLMQTAERLAVELGGQLRDQEHCLVTHQTLMQKREQLVASLFVSA